MPSVIRADADTIAPSWRDHSAARGLLQRAQGAFQKWPEGFHGFHAALTVTLEGRERTGRALVGPRGEIEITLSDAAAQEWVRAVLAEIVAERTPRFFKDGDGRFPVAFEPATGADGLGPRLIVHRGDGTPIRYRLDERARLRECEREEEGQRRVETYESFCRATPGRVLPARRSTVFYDTSGIVRTELIEDTHRRVCHTWLPATRRVQISRLDATSIREARFDAHALL